MRILHVIDSLGVGGAETMLAVLANAFAAEGHAVQVCATRKGGAAERLISEGIPIHTLERRSRYDSRGLLRFRRLVDTGDFEIIHAHGRSTGAFVAGAKLLFGIRPAIVLHDHYGGIHIDRRVPVSFRVVTRRMLSCYVGVSEELLAWGMRAGVASDRAFCILNALPMRDWMADTKTEDAAPRTCNGEDLCIGVCLAGLRREKGILELIHALAKVRTESAYRVLVAGGVRDPEYVKACERAILDHGLGEKIALIGEVPEGRALLKRADFCVIPSLSESGPLVLIEAMLAGVPFVCTRTGGVAEAAMRAGFRAFVAPGSSEELAREIQALVEMDVAARRKRGQEAKQFAEEKFDIRGRVSEWLRVYERARAVRL